MGILLSNCCVVLHGPSFHGVDALVVTQLFLQCLKGHVLCQTNVCKYTLILMVAYTLTKTC